MLWIVAKVLLSKSADVISWFKLLLLGVLVAIWPKSNSTQVEIKFWFLDMAWDFLCLLSSTYRSVVNELG